MQQVKRNMDVFALPTIPFPQFFTFFTLGAGSFLRWFILFDMLTILGSLLAPFGSLLVTCGSPLALFGSLLVFFSFLMCVLLNKEGGWPNGETHFCRKHPRVVHRCCCLFLVPCSGKHYYIRTLAPKPWQCFLWLLSGSSRSFRLMLFLIVLMYEGARD